MDLICPERAYYLTPCSHPRSLPQRFANPTHADLSVTAHQTSSHITRKKKKIKRGENKEITEGLHYIVNYLLASLELQN